MTIGRGNGNFVISGAEITFILHLSGTFYLVIQSRSIGYAPSSTRQKSLTDMHPQR